MSNLRAEVQTHYEVLGVSREATVEEIKRAYHSRARLYHPDRHASSPVPVRTEAERWMQTLNIAWQVLQDDRRRRRYDRSLGSGPSRRGRRDANVPKAPLLGTGFSYWLGGIGLRARDGRTAYNLRVTGATTLAPLASLAPDRLMSLHASGASIPDGELIHLRDMTGLRVLDLTATPVTDTGLLHLQACTGLETLWLWNTAITDASLPLIANLTNLRQLGLGNTTITDSALVHLRKLRSLRVLQLWGTAVTGPGLVHLHGLRDLEMVSLPWKVRGRHRRRLRAALPATTLT